MIQLAMLLGSDYTVGIDGIGIVNAMEVLAGFSDADKENGVESLEGLKQFKKWTENQTLSLPGAKGAKVRKHLEKIKIEEEKVKMQIDDNGDSVALVIVPDDDECAAEKKKQDDNPAETATETASAARKRFYQEHQTKKTTWKFPPSFLTKRFERHTLNLKSIRPRKNSFGTKCLLNATFSISFASG